jgi:hypothetical protein
MKSVSGQPVVFARHRLRGLVLLIAAFSLVFASRDLFKGYSYWFDELFSVVASMDTWDSLYRKWILPDVHPPLYQLVLKPWMAVLGTSEVSTRLLSYLFAIGTIAIFSFESLRQKAPRRVLALALMGVSPSFSYYSQETRSYSMALMLASVVTIIGLNLMDSAWVSKSVAGSDINTRYMRAGYYIFSVMLSLTHYFGWIYIFTTSLVNLIQRRVEPNRFRSICLLCMISIWPMWHIANGEILKKTGGNFWIQVKPITGTLNAYLQGCFPVLSISAGSMLPWSLVVALILVGFGSFRSIRMFVFQQTILSSQIARESLYLASVIALMISTTALIDIKSPMSTDRNFIVLLPSTMLLVANSIWALYSTGVADERAPRRIAAATIFLILSLTLLKLSNEGLVARAVPRQNWKDLAAYVKYTGVCSSGCLAIGPSRNQHMVYFNGEAYGRIENLSSIWTAKHKGSMPRQDQWRLISNYPRQPVLGFHAEASGSLVNIMSKVQDSVCLQPKQGWKNHSFIVIPSELIDGKEKYSTMSYCDK